jgi:hypothetical protein
MARMVEAFVSVYVDMCTHRDDVRAAVDELPLPQGVSDVDVDCRAFTDIFGCQIAVDLTGSFDEHQEGPTIARGYATQLATLGVPAFAFCDLIRNPDRWSRPGPGD